MNDCCHDAIVIGRGPGGSSAVRFLKRVGHRVLVQEKESSPRFHVGESLPPVIRVVNVKTGLILLQFLLAALLLAGCRTALTMPQADLQAAGWSIRQGQALWTAGKNKEGVAGEILVATRPGSECFVQFAKPPFTLVTARAEAGAWSVELVTARRRFGGSGEGPARFVWFALAKEVRGRPAGGGWHFETSSEAAWCLTNALTGEVLQGYLAP